LPAGHFANLALWWSKKGNFISSNFYGENLPEWVIQFNNEKHYDKYLTKGWNLLRPSDQYNESLPDVNKYEGKLNGRIEAKFPYDFSKEYSEYGPDVIKLTPFGNDLLLELAKSAIENEKMGQGSTTDFLTVSFSSTDYVGHVLGPRSMELQDTYLRLDSTIGEFLSYLDKKVGKNNYTIFLTADHACNENPNEMHDHGYLVRNLDNKAISKQLKQFSIKKYGVDLIEDYSNQNLFFNQDSIQSISRSMNDIKKEFVTYLESIDYIKRAYTEEDILLSSTTDPNLERIARGYDPKQNGQIVVLYNPGFMEYGYTGTTHGSSYGYDTHVPGLFFGHGIKHGYSHQKVEITSIAPTIAQLIGIAFPNSTEAVVLEELLPKK
jgi:predicted AlkP superfamily pyrophosphatase or phosphodiesterase